MSFSHIEVHSVYNSRTEWQMTRNSDFHTIEESVPCSSRFTPSEIYGNNLPFYSAVVIVYDTISFSNFISKTVSNLLELITMREITRQLWILWCPHISYHIISYPVVMPFHPIWRFCLLILYLNYVWWESFARAILNTTVAE